MTPFTCASDGSTRGLQRHNGASPYHQVGGNDFDDRQSGTEIMFDVVMRTRRVAVAAGRGSQSMKLLRRIMIIITMVME